MKKEQKMEQQPNSDSTADNLQVSPTCPKPIVSGIPIIELTISESLQSYIDAVSSLKKEFEDYRSKFLGIPADKLGNPGCR